MISLENLLTQGRLDVATKSIAEAFIGKHQLAKIDQLAFATDSAENVVEMLEATRNTDTFLISEATLPNWIEKGIKKSFIGKVGVGYIDGIQIELLEPGIGSDFYSQLLTDNGQSRLHHLGFFVKQLQPYTEKLEAAGFPLYVAGKSIVGSMEVNFHYMDTFQLLGFYIEFICFSQNGKSFLPKAELIQKMALKQRKFNKKP